MTESWMLSRLSRETKQHQHLADDDRRALLCVDANPAAYTAMLSRIYGFEAPVQTALLMTAGIEEWIDVRDRARVRLLRADLQSLGLTDMSVVPRCRAISPFGHPAEALGWVYVLEHNNLLHDVIERQLRVRMPSVMKAAGSYLAGQRANPRRWHDLGSAMDRLARDSTMADQIVASARAAFRVQHDWYQLAVPQRARVA